MRPSTAKAKVAPKNMLIAATAEVRSLAMIAAIVTKSRMSRFIPCSFPLKRDAHLDAPPHEVEHNTSSEQEHLKQRRAARKEGRYCHNEHGQKGSSHGALLRLPAFLHSWRSKRGACCVL